MANVGIRAQRLSEVGQRATALRDIAGITFATLLVGFVCIRLNVSETLFHWTRRFEGVQFDELPVVLLSLSIGLVWFAARRYREASATLTSQRQIDARLSVALEENRCLAQQYLTAQESERKNLARELHDELGQYLNAIKIDAVAMRDGAVHDPTEVRATAGAIVRNIDHVYTVVTGLIRRLRPVGLDDLGLVAAIEHCIEQWRSRLPALQISLAVEGDLAGLSEQVNLTVYRLAQESITNAARHSQAAHLSVKLSRSIAPSRIDIAVTDDGIGANLSESRGGFGLVSMRERVEMQGGNFEVRSAPSQGFALQAHFPV